MKVLASDFDNTLYFKNKKGGFHDCDIKAIHAFQRKGNLFGICSGRPIAGLIHELKGIIEPDFIIASTGALILDKRYQLLYGQSLPVDIAHHIHMTYQNETALLIQTLSKKYVYVSDLHDKNDQHAYLIHSILDVHDDIYSLSLIESTIERATFITQEINQKYDEVIAYQNMDSIDVVSKECSKGHAIERLKEIYRLSNIAGIGDSYNDLPMMDAVDCSFTFEHSPRSIQEQCDYIVTTIAEAIEILEKE